MNVLNQCLLVFLVSSGLSEAILSGGETGKSSNQTEAGKTDSQIIDSFKANATTTTHSSSENTNSTFYYEADTFLLNKNDRQQQPAGSGKEKKSSSSEASIEPASIGSTSARNGRMLDLDALVGDFAASQSVKAARSQTGNRQSRFLPSSQTLDVGKGKKLHIQGFIPIVGVQDVTGEEPSSSSGHSDLDQQQQQSSYYKKSNEELPYAQSSIGHASFVSPQQINQQIDAKFSGAGVVDSLRGPIKKLMRYGETQQQNSANNIQRQPSGCLCVPFYMCKNGFISESSLGASHIQQMIMSQQQQAAYPLQAQPKAAQHLTIVPAPKAIDSIVYGQAASNQQAEFATFSAQVDERSLDRDLITMGPLTGTLNDELKQAGSNQTNDGAEPHANQAPNNLEGDAVNSTSDLSQSNDYSQEILGRMLGIKSISGSKSSSSSDSNGPTGVCGLLRTCCNIPAHLIPNGQHQDFLVGESMMTNQGQMSFSSSSSQPISSNRYVTRPQTNQLDMMQQHQSPPPLKRAQPQSTNALQRGTPYGFPSTQISRMQPLNSPDQMALMSTALAHRSNMFPQSSSAANRFQVMSPSQPGDYKRAPQQLQYVSSAQQHQAMSQAHHAMISAASDQQQSNAIRMATNGPANNGLYQSQPVNELGLGTRKILEGRCGLRQSAGINGRVQNLQYQENSADFGEYPAQAAILKRLSGTDSMFVCGGTLISQYWIATAAHCIKKHPISELKIRLGEWDVHRDDEFYPFVEKGIRDLVVHSEFVPGNLVNDIALLRLDSPVDASLPHVNPACLPTLDESFTNQKCWVTGWGKDSFGQKGSFQTVLQEVELPVVGQAECESALKQTRLGPHYRLHSGFICAGGEGGKDACEGDGGSGLYCLQDGLIKVAGLVSWGIGCGQSGVPGVYVSLAHYRPWIENIISIDEDIYSRSSNTTTESDKTIISSV